MYLKHKDYSLIIKMRVIPNMPFSKVIIGLEIIYAPR